MAQDADSEAVASEVQQAFVEYLERIDRGEQLSAEDFLKEHPALAPELQSLVFASERLAGMGSPPAKDTAAKEAVPTIPPSSVSAAALSGPAGAISFPTMMGRYRIDKE